MILRFIDSNNKRQELATFSELGFNKTSMHLIDTKLTDLLLRGTQGYMEIFQITEKNDKYFKNGEILEFTEENFHQILEFAQQLNIKWHYLLNLNFDLQKISVLAYKLFEGFIKTTSSDLWLAVETRHDPIVIILELLDPRGRNPAPPRVAIEHLIKQFGKGVLTKENLYLMKEFFY